MLELSVEPRWRSNDSVISIRVKLQSVTVFPPPSYSSENPPRPSSDLREKKAVAAHELLHFEDIPSLNFVMFQFNIMLESLDFGSPREAESAGSPQPQPQPIDDVSFGSQKTSIF